MARYRFIGRRPDGSSVGGLSVAANEAELELRLLADGILLESSRPALSVLQKFFVGHLRRAEVTRVTRQISVFLKSKIPVLEALQLAREQALDACIGGILDAISGDVEAGRSMASAFAQYPFLFDRFYVSMIEVGEISGSLDVAFDRIATYREKYESVKRKIRSALTYPALVVVVAILVMFALIMYVIPMFVSMYVNFGAQLPTLTRTVIAASDSLKGAMWFWLTVGPIGISILPLAFATTRVKRTVHKWALRLPIIRRLTLKIITVRFCRTMGAMLISGVDILVGLHIASKTTGNLYADTLLEQAGYRLAQGKSFTESIERCGLFPRAMLRLAASGEKTGRLGEMLTHAADYYENETETEIATITSLIEPLIIIVLGIFITLVLVSMYLPLFQLMGTVS